MKHQARLLEVLRDAIVGTVRQDARDLTQRQLAILLICCLEPLPQTVRGLREKLGISKPAITRGIDTLEDYNFARRQHDPRDRRSVLILATAAGRALVQQLGSMMERSALGLPAAPPVPAEVPTASSERAAEHPVDFR